MRDVQEMVQEALDAELAAESVVRLHAEAAGQGQGDEFLAFVLEHDGDLEVELLSAAPGSVPHPPDRITRWLRGLPLVGGQLARTREAMGFLRSRDDDPAAVRIVKLCGKGLTIVATGMTGYVLVAESD